MTQEQIARIEQCKRIIADCELALHRTLSRGERTDLLLDNCDWIASSVEAHEIVDFISL